LTDSDEKTVFEEELEPVKNLATSAAEEKAMR